MLQAYDGCYPASCATTLQSWVLWGCTDDTQFGSIDG